MGGGIAVTSEVGRGSVFSICVPANGAARLIYAFAAASAIRTPELALAR